MYLRCKGDDVIKIYGSAKAVNYYKTARLFLEITGCSEIWILGNCKIGIWEIILAFSNFEITFDEVF